MIEVSLESQTELNFVEINKIEPIDFLVDDCVDLDWKTKLENSIRKVDITQPILVRKHSTKPGFFELVEGYDRYSIYKDLGKKEIPCLIKDLSDTEVVTSVISSDLKKHMRPLKISKCYSYLQEQGYSTRKLASKFGEQHSDISRIINLPKQSPKVVRYLNSGKLDNWSVFELEPLLGFEKRFTKVCGQKEKWTKEQQELFEKEKNERFHAQDNIADDAVKNHWATEKIRWKVRDYKRKLDSELGQKLKQFKKGPSTNEWNWNSIPNLKVFIKDSKDMSDVESETVALTVTSPPYFSFNKEYEHEKTEEEYFQNLFGVLKEVERVTMPGGLIVINIDDLPSKKSNIIGYLPIISKLESFMTEELALDILPPRIWSKPIAWSRFSHLTSTNIIRNSISAHNFEFILFFKKKGEIKRTKIEMEEHKRIPKKILNDYFSSVWSKTNGKNQNHPAVFSEELIYPIILMNSYPNDVVMDPFGGTAVTAKVSLELGRKAIIFEREQRYVPVIKETLSELLVPSRCEI